MVYGGMLFYSYYKKDFLRGVRMKKILPIVLILAMLFFSAIDQSNSVTGILKVHFIDVEQGDSILIQSDDEVMLIDAGTNAKADFVVDYIKKQGIRKIDYLVGTHPHEDHIGGLDSVIENFDIGTIYMPRVTHTTKTFRDVLNAVKEKGLKITSPSAGTTFDLADAKCKVISPNSKNYSSLNDYSIVIKLSYGKNSFLFTGDGEALAENEIIEKGFDLAADVLKVGHHGSNTSNTEEFLKKVNPSYAVISLGEDNKYGHPHKEVMDRLEKREMTIYRTDKNGTIIAESDGESIVFKLEKGGA